MQGVVPCVPARLTTRFGSVGRAAILQNLRPTPLHQSCCRHHRPGLRRSPDRLPSARV